MEVAQEAQNREAFLQAVVNTLERRLFYIPSFKIYRGVAGLYDYGSPGCAVKSNVLTFWRQVSHNEEDENIRLQMSLYLLQKTLPLIRHIQVERTLELDVGAHIQGVQFTEEDLPKAILD